MALLEDQNVEWLVCSMTEQLSLAYPQGLCGGDDNSDAKDDILDEDRLKDLLQQGLDTQDIENFSAAFPRAIQQWKSRSTKTSGSCTSKHASAPTKLVKTSFSLFDQIQGGFAPPITLEDIQDAPSVEERLKVLEKIAFIDDLLMDWSEIAPILKKDLLSNVPTIAFDVLSMHRKWFDLGRSNSEYTPLLYSLCQNLLETVVNKILHPSCDVEGSEDGSRFMTSLVRNWRDMWLDLMQRDQYSEDLVEDMEVGMILVFLRSLGSRNDSILSMCSIVQEALAMIDTPCRWFQSWTNRVGSNRHLCSLLTGTTFLLPDLWIRIQAFPTTTNPSTCARELQAISILSITLSRTRVSQFPWEALNGTSPVTPLTQEGLGDWKHFVEEQKTGDALRWQLSSMSTASSASISLTSTNASNEVIPELMEKMLDLFLRAITYLPLHNNESQKSVLLNGIETILLGCHAGTHAYDGFRHKVIGTLKTRAATGDTTVIRFLETNLLY